MVSPSMTRPAKRRLQSTNDESEERPALSRSKSNEKELKIQRDQHSQAKNAIVFLGMMSLIFLALVVKLRHNHDIPRHRFGLRLAQKQHESLSEVSKPQGERTTFIPPSSIYSLSVPDISGNMVSLEKFHGMVTLIVNVACL